MLLLKFRTVINGCYKYRSYGYGMEWTETDRAAASARVLESTRLQKLLQIIFTTRVLVKFYFRLQISTSGFNFCKLNY